MSILKKRKKKKKTVFLTVPFSLSFSPRVDKFLTNYRRLANILFLQVNILQEKGRGKIVRTKILDITILEWTSMTKRAFLFSFFFFFLFLCFFIYFFILILIFAPRTININLHFQGGNIQGVVNQDVLFQRHWLQRSRPVSVYINTFWFTLNKYNTYIRITYTDIFYTSLDVYRKEEERRK